jgi:peroxiredoxin Q/BCP
MSFSPTLSLHTADGHIHSISYMDMLQKSPYTLLYFYPRDSTPGCTVQAQDFSANIEKFKEK